MSTADCILLRVAGRVNQEKYMEVKALAADAGASRVRGYANDEESYVYFDFDAPREPGPGPFCVTPCVSDSYVCS